MGKSAERRKQDENAMHKNLDIRADARYSTSRLRSTTRNAVCWCWMGISVLDASARQEVSQTPFTQSQVPLRGLVLRAGQRNLHICTNSGLYEVFVLLRIAHYLSCCNRVVQRGSCGHGATTPTDGRRPASSILTFANRWQPLIRQ